MELTTKNWKEFRIGDLFDQIGSTAVKKPFDKRNTPEDEFIIPALSSKIDNNSFGFYVREEDHLLINRLCLSVTLNGDAGKVYVQNKAFAIAQDAYAIYLKDDFNILNNEVIYLFLATIMEKVLIPKYGYTNKATWNKVKKETLLLPSKNDEPDWDFMEEFIKGIEEKYIENVDKYNQENIDKALSVTGLTTADLNGNLEVKPADRYEEFRVGDLFNIETSPSFDMVNIDISNKINDDYKYEFIIRSKDNYGVKGYVKHLGIEPNEKNKITISQVGTIVAQYRTNDYYTSQNIFNLSPKFDLTENKVLFFVSSLNCVLKKYSGYSDYPTLKSLKNEKIKLPAIDEDTPDFDYMEKAIYIYILKRSLSLGKWITKKKSEL